MAFVNFSDLAPALQQELRESKPLPDSAEPELAKRMFWVRKDGHMSRKKGCWEFRAKAERELRLQIKSIQDHPYGPLDPPGKGSLREWKPGVTFSLDVTEVAS